jgi:hypothetical protein
MTIKEDLTSKSGAEEFYLFPEPRLSTVELVLLGLLKKSLLLSF